MGDFLLTYVNEHPDTAEKFLVEGMSILKSLDEMRKAAVNKKTGNYALLSPQEGFEIVLKHFGIEEKSSVPGMISIQVHLSELPKAPVEAKPKNTDFDIELDDLLE